MKVELLMHYDTIYDQRLCGKRQFFFLISKEQNKELLIKYKINKRFILSDFFSELNFLQCEIKL